MRYLLVTHIPFAMQADGTATLDRLWCEDLIGLAGSIGTVTVAAPCMDLEAMKAWGTGFATVAAGGALQFVALPVRGGRLDVLYGLRLRKALRDAVGKADLVHTSNLFGRDVALYFAHDLAVKSGKKTLFVVAEDFVDMLGWEWVRTAPNALQQWRRRRTLRSLDAHVRRRIASASLVFLHTPAAVARYRLDASNAFAIRQPVHECADVVGSEALAHKQAEVVGGATLRLVTASRMQPLKGLDFLLRAIALLRERAVEVRLTMYGGGPAKSELRQLAARLGIADCVDFAGALAAGPELRHALVLHHVFVMPHLTTDFGRGFFDAMAAGCPVVAFRSAASEGTIREGVDGNLVANADVEALAAAIARLHVDRAATVAMMANAQTRAVENTRAGWNKLRAQWIQELL